MLQLESKILKRDNNQVGKRIISFSVWGTSKLYLRGAIDNIECAKKYYPSWMCRFYVAENCPVKTDLLARSDCEVIEMPPIDTLDKTQEGWVDSDKHAAMMWRFLAITDPNVERVIFRDTDSRVNPREAKAVQEWVDGGALGHIIYDNPAHVATALMPGLSGLVTSPDLWGSENDLIVKMTHFFKNYKQIYNNEPMAFLDILFMKDIIFSQIYYSVILHGLNMPNPLTESMPEGLGNFCGDVVNPECRNLDYVPEER